MNHYAIHTIALSENITERKLLIFASKNDRARYIDNHGVARPIREKEARTYKAAGPRHPVYDKGLDMRFHEQIVS